MRTSAPPELAGSQLPSTGPTWPRLLLYVLLASLLFYPLLEKLVAPLLAASYVVMLVATLLRLIARGYRLPGSFVWSLWLMFSMVYAAWYGVAVFRQNNGTYINQDSFGFLLYVGLLPVVYLYTTFYDLKPAMLKFVEGCCTALAAVSLLLVGGYHLVFGAVEYDSLFLFNAYIQRLGLNWQIDHNNGLLGLYTYAGHVLLLGLALVLHRYCRFRRRPDLLRALLYLVGIVLDGHRALVIAALIELVIVVPALFNALPLRERRVVLNGAVALAVVCGLLSADWISERFSFTEADVSTSERHAQTPALLDKIAENPILGGGFGTVAAYVRSAERPFSYEVDFLATIMKLGLVGSLMYFGTYFYALWHAWRCRGQVGRFIAASGIGFFFYMGSNGNQAMSTDSAVFHIVLFLTIAAVPRLRVLRRTNALPASPTA